MFLDKPINMYDCFFLSLNKSLMDYYFLHSSLFNTVKEMTASNNSLLLKEVSCFWLQVQENEKYHIGMTRKRYFCLRNYLGLCDFIYYCR